MVSVENVTKTYPLYRRPSDRLVESLPFFQVHRHQDFHAVRDVTLHVNQGETFALVGPNGSGKSTLLQMIAGVVQPTSGTISVTGKIAALLELGAGFNPEFTGRENVYLNSELHGLSLAKTTSLFPQIEAFADIGAFIDRPVKEYSSGMYVRLAFATAIHVEPDILVVDEALAVGDVRFANRCIRKLEELKEQGTTILFVSHDLGLVKRLCDRAALLLQGKIDLIGSPSDVVNRYVGLVLDPDSEDKSYGRSNSRHGNGASEIVEARLLSGDGKSCSSFNSGDPVAVDLKILFHQPVENPKIGLLIRNRLGVDVYGTNTRIENIEFGSFQAGDQLKVQFVFPCHLTRQSYSLTVATQNQDGTSQDWRDDLLYFSVTDAKEIAGVVDLCARIEWKKNEN